MTVILVGSIFRSISNVPVPFKEDGLYLIPEIKDKLSQTEVVNEIIQVETNLGNVQIINHSDRSQNFQISWRFPGKELMDNKDEINQCDQSKLDVNRDIRHDHLSSEERQKFIQS